MRATRRRVGALLAVSALCLSVVGLAASTPAAASSHSRSKTVWLCNPTGKGFDPCTVGRAATAVTGTGATSITHSPATSSASKFDCFYVYPTVSSESGSNADLQIQPVEIVTAELQASRFSQVCRVWAPMYRQRTVASLNQGLGAAMKSSKIALASLLSAWKDYLAHDNHKRPIILIGHSQGAAILINVLQTQFDRSPTLRSRLVSAIILGGNVQVPIGKDVGGTFGHIPTCGSATQTGCVIAYSSFGSRPPANSLFGRPGQGVSLQSGQTASSGEQVACVNPVNFSNAPGSPLPYFAEASAGPKGVTVTTQWVAYPHLYTATCELSDGASWLNIASNATSSDPRPLVKAALGPTWGYHTSDVNLTLGNLVLDVALEEASYQH